LTRLYYDKFGFDEQVIASRLALLGLGETELLLARQLNKKVIQPHIDHIIHVFYQLLLQNNEFSSVIERGFSIQKLQSSQRDYLLSLGLDFTEADYFEQRLRIGMAHVWAGVSLHLYQCAYRILQQLLIDHIPAGSKKRDVLIAFILKITNLDMSLAIEAYHNAQIHGLTESIEELTDMTSKLENRLKYDSLTKVLTRESVLSLLEEDVQQAHKHKHPLSIIMADLDFFKQVNDKHGHQIGDEVLADIAARIASTLRQQDVVGRYGGEEFVVVLNKADSKAAADIAERIRRRVADYPFKVDHVKLQMTLSQGVAQLTEQDSMESLIRRADNALYQSKRHGRNRVEE
jgi:diguanylate cyclase (GGDEF)-like protein